MDELQGSNNWYDDVPYQECKSIIRERLASMSRDFIAVGYYLKYIRDKKLYQEDGYTTIWEFAEDNYGIKTSTASRWMAMNDKFSHNGNSPLLDERYQDFGKSQLQEMLYLNDGQMEQAEPVMTAKEIRAIRKPEKKSFQECSAYKVNGCCNNCCYENNGNCPYDLTDYKVTDWRVENDKQTQAERDRIRQEGKSKDEPCSKCKLNGNEDAGILECHPEKGEHKCVTGYKDTVAPAQKEPEPATDCPPGISSCIRQEWGTDPDQQERGRKECKKCWKDYENIQKALESKSKTEKESVAPAQEELEGKREVLHFTADDKSIDNAYGAMIAELIHNYLDNDYKAPDRECEASVFGQTYKVLKRSEVTVFYTADGETFFDVENARLEREYQYWQQNKAMLEQPSVVEDTAESEECSVIEEYVTITPQDVLHEAQKQLNDWIEAFKDDTEPDFIRKQKIIVAALAGMVCDLEDLPPEPGPQPELPLLKNSDQRKEWLNNYKSWGIWYSDDRIGARYYRYQFKNGAVLIIVEYTAPATEYFEEHDRSYFHLVGGPEPPKGKYGYGKWQRYERYNRDTSSETELIEFLKEVQKK